MVGRSGDLRRIIQPHWEALCGLLGNARMTPYAQKRREAGRPVWADMALDGLFLLRRLTLWWSAAPNLYKLNSYPDLGAPA